MPELQLMHAPQFGIREQNAKHKSRAATAQHTQEITGINV
jgi:hypothetical protein